MGTCIIQNNKVCSMETYRSGKLRIRNRFLLTQLWTKWCNTLLLVKRLYSPKCTNLSQCAKPNPINDLFASWKQATVSIGACFVVCVSKHSRSQFSNCLLLSFASDLLFIQMLRFMYRNLFPNFSMLKQVETSWTGKSNFWEILFTNLQMVSLPSRQMYWLWVHQELNPQSYPIVLLTTYNNQLTH